jgi:hypothetical protein
MAFVEDLSGRSLEVIARACKIYRQDAKNRWMATPGALLKIIRDISLPAELPRRVEREKELIPPKKVARVIAATRAKYPMAFGRGQAEKKELTAYVRSSPELISKAKALVRRVKKEQKEQEKRESQ